MTNASRSQAQGGWDEQLRPILDSALDAVIMMDVDGRVVDWNRQAEEIFGWQRDEVLGRPLAELIMPARYHDAHREGLAHYRKTGEGPVLNRRLELTAVNQGGEEFPVEVSIAPVRLGNTTIFNAFVRDIRIRRREEKRLQRETAESQMLQETTTALAATRSLDEAIQQCLDAVCRWTDWPVGHVYLPDDDGQVLRPANIWHVPDDAPFEALRKAMANRELSRGEGLPGRAWARDEPTWMANVYADESFVRSAGDDRLGIAGAFALPITAGDEIVAVLEFFSRQEEPPDYYLLAALKRVSDQLGRVMERRQWEDERAHLAAIVDSSYEAIIGKKPDGTITSWNKGAERVYGYSEEEAVGESISLIIPTEMQEEEPELAEVFIHGKRVEQFETVRQRQDGQRIDLSITVSPICDEDGRVIGTSTVERDITRRKQAERDLVKAKEAAEAASRAKSAFLANISHELRTPMNAIIGMVELALGEELTEVLQGHLETARDSAHTLLFLLNDLLDFSRMEAGRFELNPAPFSLRETLEATMKTLLLRAHEKGLELTCHVAANVPDALQGDGRRLQQVIMNLAGNALKFTEEGEVAVHAELESREDDTVTVHFTVVDTGIGLAAEDQERIFRSFTQVDATTTREHAGAGLGLAICQQIIHRMGGRVWVKSELGQGSQFHCLARFETLPVEQDRDATRDIKRRPHPPKDARTEGVELFSRPLRILLAEDTPANQKVTRAILSKRGHHVTVANNGREAVDQHQQDEFDVILMDIQMPTMDGLQATATIRQASDPAKSNVPIIAMTAHAMKGDREKCLAAGMDEYISKPINADELLGVVERLAQRQPSSSAEDPAEGTNATSATPVIDHEAAMRRLGGDEQLFLELVQFFDEDSPGLLESIRQGISDEDAAQVARAAHSLKGLAANFGAAAAAKACLELETLGTAGDLAQADAALISVERELKRLDEALARYRNG